MSEHPGQMINESELACLYLQITCFILDSVPLRLRLFSKEVRL